MDHFGRSMGWWWSLGFFLALLLPTLVNGKKASKSKIGVWFHVITLIPAVLNFISLILILLTVHHIKQTTRMVSMICTSAHLLARCAVRLSVSPAAKKSIFEYARTRPEFADLLQKQGL